MQPAVFGLFREEKRERMATVSELLREKKKKGTGSIQDPQAWRARRFGELGRVRRLRRAAELGARAWGDSGRVREEAHVPRADTKRACVRIGLGRSVPPGRFAR